METLLNVIEKVGKRIQRHGEVLRKNEMLTRYALVDPVLRALGWDTEDPDQVVPEFQTEVGRPDYILLCKTGEGKDFRLGVEAKHYGSDEKTFDDARRKALPLFQERGIRYYVITDGDRWVLWDISKPKIEHPDPIVDVRISRDHPGEVARKLLALWRPAIPHVEPAPEPVVSISWQPPEGFRWMSLAELEHRRKSKQWKPHQPSPRNVRFPDGRTEAISAWKGLLTAVARWAFPHLKARGRLPLGRLIVRDPSSLRAPFELMDGYYLETWFGAKDCLHNAVRILQAAGIGPAQVQVELPRSP